jgi:choline dehydrogenase
MAFADSGLTDTEPNLKWRPRADIQIHHTPTFSANKSPSAKAVGIEPWIKKAEMYGVTMLPSLLVPRSVGTVEITSSDPSVRPIVDPHYLEHPDDIEILKQAIKMCLKTAEAEPLKSKVKQIHFRPSALETFNNDHTTDEFIEDHIRSNAITIYHPTSSVKMGADEASPLDLRCRVRGIAGLRVVDASSFPDLVSGNTNGWLDY